MASAATANSNPNYARVSTTTSALEVDPPDDASQQSIAAATATASASVASSHLHRRSAADRLTDKAIALLWVGAAILTAKWTNFWSVLLLLPTDESETEKTSTTTALPPNRNLLSIAFVLLGMNTVLLVYLSVYLPYCKGLVDPNAWHVYCPRVIPSMTFVGVLCALLLIRATWPVWGFWAPWILGVEFFGGLFALHFVPVFW